MLKPVMVTSKLQNNLKVCYNIIKVGPDVKELRVGMHVLHISAAGDKVSDSDIEIIREEDVISWWYPPEAKLDIPVPEWLNP